MPISLGLAASSYMLMLIAYKLSKYRYLHIPLMVTVLAIDLAMPFYLYQVGNWEQRLIDQEEIFSFLVWMHLGLIISVYVLFAAQIFTAVKFLRGGNADAREQHRLQGRAAIWIKALVVITGAILVK